MKEGHHLIQALQNKALYPHEVTEFKLIETHLSWVILTGPYAYKIKKPLNLGFQDFTTLEKRHYYCELELKLNQRLAAVLYLEVVPITGTADQPQWNGQSSPIEYAIKMRQFSQDDLLSVLAQQGKLNQGIFNDLAQQIAQFHLATERSDPASALGTPSDINAPVQDNFRVLKSLPSCQHYLPQVEQIEAWCKQQFDQLLDLLHLRKTQGFIRACHGDLHLGNIVMYRNKPLIFDCIEFNESFRWIDVFNDIAFLTMDLLEKNERPSAYYFINRYLEYTHDYHGVPLLPFYESYRAMVRAKVLSLQLEQLPPSSALIPKLQTQIAGFFNIAQSFTQEPSPTLTITFGLSGSGKTLYTQQLLMQSGAIRLRSDICRKHLYGLNLDSLSSSKQKETIYASEGIRAVYQELKELAHTLLRSGFKVIIDATCLKRWQRALFIELAEKLDISVQILAFEAPLEILQNRIQHRLKEGLDVSEANEAVLMNQLNEIEPLTEKEKAITTFIPVQEVDNLFSSSS